VVVHITTDRVRPSGAGRGRGLLREAALPAASNRSGMCLCKWGRYRHSVRQTDSILLSDAVNR